MKVTCSEAVPEPRNSVIQIGLGEKALMASVIREIAKSARL